MIELSPGTRRQAIGAPDPVQTLRVNGSALVVKRWGAGRPVLCLHAVGHGSGDFEGLAVRLADGPGEAFELIAVDWPGQGRSPSDGLGVRAARYADLALGVADQLALERPIVIGNSIGGAAALIAAARQPDRFGGLVLCNPGGLVPIDPFARVALRRMAAFFDAGARGAFWFPAVFAAYYRSLVLTGAEAGAQRERIIAAATELAPLLADAWRGFEVADADIRALVPDVRIPVWLAWCRGDQFVSWGRSRAAALRFPDCQLSLFAGSHCAFLENPHQFTLEFRAFAGSAVKGDVSWS